LAAVTEVSPCSKIGLIVLAYIAFISLGMPDGLFGVAWPSIREVFGLRLDSVGAFFFAATTGNMLSSFFSGKAMARLRVGGTLAASGAEPGWRSGTKFLARGDPCLSGRSLPVIDPLYLTVSRPHRMAS